MSNKRKLVKIMVPASFFKDSFHMPIGTEIVAVSLIHGVIGEPGLEFTVSHADLPELEEGQKIPNCFPVIHKITWDWNL